MILNVIIRHMKKRTLIIVLGIWIAMIPMLGLQIFGKIELSLYQH